MGATAVAIEPDNTLIEPVARRPAPAPAPAQMRAGGAQASARTHISRPASATSTRVNVASRNTNVAGSTNVASKSANVASRTTNVNVNRAANVNIQKLCAAGELLVAPGGAVAAWRSDRRRHRRDGGSVGRHRSRARILLVLH